MTSQIIQHTKTFNCENGSPIETFIIECPRLIWAEVLTHKAIVRNSASSRAMPARAVAEVPNYIPPVLYKNGKGMSSKTLLTQQETLEAQNLIIDAREYVEAMVAKLYEIGVHKQHANRYLEPFKMHKAILTSTNFQNFYDLRISPDAQPEIQELATKMRDSVCDVDARGGYLDFIHLPFSMDKYIELGGRYDIDLKDRDELIIQDVANCARISYGLSSEIDIKDAFRIFKRLWEDRHYSPFEHVAFGVYKSIRQEAYTGWRGLRNRPLEVERLIKDGEKYGFSK